MCGFCLLRAIILSVHNFMLSSCGDFVQIVPDWHCGWIWLTEDNFYTVLLGHNFAKGHCAQSGVGALQISRPRKMK